MGRIACNVLSRVLKLSHKVLRPMSWAQKHYKGTGMPRFFFFLRNRAYERRPYVFNCKVLSEGVWLLHCFKEVNLLMPRVDYVYSLTV